jgi:hypothetical protein
VETTWDILNEMEMIKHRMELIKKTNGAYSSNCFSRKKNP